MSEIKRRAFLHCLAGASALAAFSHDSLALAGPEAGSAPNAKKISILGDSMIAGGFGLYLEQALEKDPGYLVARQGKSSTGLARPDFYNWMKEGQSQCQKEHPDAVVVMFGGNDGQGLWMGRKAEPKWIRYEEEGWTAEYRRRVNEFADVVSAGGKELIWIGMPVMRPTKLHSRVAHMNDIYRAEMAIRPNAHFIDIWPILANGEGKYADHVKVDGKKVRVRAQDGVHLSRSGAHHLVSQVAPQIAQIMGPAAR
jgi:hypothetical protein